MISSSSVVLARFVAVRRTPSMRAGLDDPDRDVRVPDVDGEEHAAIIRGRPCAPDEACGPSASVRGDAKPLETNCQTQPGSAG